MVQTRKLLRLFRDGRKFARLALGVRARRPREVQLEVTNRCNLDCDMCPRITTLKVPEKDMAPDVFEAVLERLERPEAITLTGWGEPLMHPRLFDYIDRALERWPGVEVGFTTNGHLLTDGMVSKILARRIARVNISLEELPWAEGDLAAPPSPPHDERAGNPLKGGENRVARDGHPTPPKVVDHLRRFLDRRERQAARGEHAPEVRLQVVLFPAGGRVAERLIDFAAELRFQAVNLVRLDVRGRPDLKRPSWDEERALLALCRARGVARGIPVGSVNDHGALLKVASRGDRFCMRLDNYIYVDVHGNVAPCCLLRSVKTGNLVEQTLDEVWNGEAMRRFYGPGVHPACVGCDAFMNGYGESGSSTA